MKYAISKFFEINLNNLTRYLKKKKNPKLITPKIPPPSHFLSLLENRRPPPSLIIRIHQSTARKYQSTTTPASTEKPPSASSGLHINATLRLCRIAVPCLSIAVSRLSNVGPLVSSATSLLRLHKRHLRLRKTPGPATAKTSCGN